MLPRILNRGLFGIGGVMRRGMLGTVVPSMGAKSKANKARKAAANSADTGSAEAFDLALNHLTKTFGAGSVMRLGDKAVGMSDLEVIPSGSLLLDRALGVGGYPKGRVVEIFGPESSGKTTLALHAVAECQKMGGKVCFVDAEHALDPEYARNLGVDIDNMYISQPDYGEQGLEIADTLIRSGGVDLVVVDSVAALVPRAEVEGEMGDVHMGLQARMMSQALRKLTSSLGRSRATVIFLNQIRMKIGVLFGSPETTPGGNALRFFSSIRMDIRKIGKINGPAPGESASSSDVLIGNRVRVKVVKNKLAPPFREAEIDVEFASGIRRDAEILSLAVSQGIVTKKGSWYTIDGDPLGQGREAAAAAIASDEKLAMEIEEAIKSNSNASASNEDSGEIDETEEASADDSNTDPDQPEKGADLTKKKKKKKGKGEK